MNVKTVFYSLLFTFGLILAFFIFPLTDSFAVLALLGIAFFIQGFILISFTNQSKIKKKTFLYITGVSAIGVIASVLIHNFVYAFTSNEEAFFFILAVIAFPATFVVGAIGTILQRNY